MALTLYAIPNCDTVKKARKWLEEQGVDYDFHDYKKAGVPTDTLAQACEKFGWEQVVNRKGMTWRKMDDAQKSAITDQKAAIALMVEKPSIIKRPLIVGDAPMALGFKEDEYRVIFSQ